jgi:thiol-disulfide isomerase/thioredoxin
MFKKLLVCAALCAFVSAANAQISRTQTQPRTAATATPRHLMKWNACKAPLKANLIRRADATSTTLVLRYWSDDDDLYVDGGKVIGKVGAAIYLPDMAGFKGDSITRIYFMNQATSVTDMQVFIAKDLEADPVFTQAIPTVSSNAEYDVALTTPYIIDGDPIYVGYSMNITDTTSSKNQYPNIVNAGSNPYGYYSYLADVTYNDWEQDGEYYGNAIISATVQGTNMPHNNVSLTSISSEKGLVGDSIFITGSVSNQGVETVDSITLNYKYSMAKNLKTVKLDAPMKGYGTSGTFTLLQMGPTSGHYTVSTTVTKVNNADNTSTLDAVQSGLVTMENTFPRVSVMEEGTGDWCGFCPRGITGINKLKKEYGDKIIAIALHSGDEMEDSTYAPITSQFSGFPDCLMDRTNEGDPYYDAEDLYSASQAEPTEGTISFTCNYKDDTQKAITVASTSKFSISVTTSPYRVAYALVEDSVTGSSYEQKNYFNLDSIIAGGYTKEQAIEGYGEEIINDWGSQPYVIAPFVFNHVGVGIFDAKGIENSIFGAIEPGTEYKHSMDITLPTTIQNKKNVKVVAMIIDALTSRIVNAAETTIGPSTGIVAPSTESASAFAISAKGNLVSITADKARAQIFTADGRLVASKNVRGYVSIPLNGKKGVFMVRVADGNRVVVKKVSM